MNDVNKDTNINEYTIVVFDLDETMGYFSELGMFWSSLNKLIETNRIPFILNEQIFYHLCDLYPEFLRPSIISILEFLKEKKIQNSCQKIMIYTNNKANIMWPQMIKNYFENKINYVLFDQIICAFKINGERIEPNRSCHEKTYYDLVNCTKIPEHTRICFIDDTYHEGMNNEKIYYINIKPYDFKLPFEILIERFFNSGLWEKIKITSELNLIDNEQIYKEYIYDLLCKYNFTYQPKTSFSYKIDKILSKKILHHLQTFFNMPNNHQIQYPAIKSKSKKFKKSELKIKKNKTLKKRLPF